MSPPLEFLQESQCAYCKREIEQHVIESSWSETQKQHYKTIHCPHCLKKTWAKVDFIGSGHDCLTYSKLESLVGGTSFFKPLKFIPT